MANKRQVKSVLHKICLANQKYKKYYGSRNRLMIPYPIQKDLIKLWLQPTYIPTNGTYDYTDAATKTLKIEVKSSCLKNGCTPFKTTQNACNEIIYFEILLPVIKVFKLSQQEVGTINSLVSSGKCNIVCGKHCKNSILLLQIKI